MARANIAAHAARAAAAGARGIGEFTRPGYKSRSPNAAVVALGVMAIAFTVPHLFATETVTAVAGRPVTSPRAARGLERR